MRTKGEITVEIQNNRDQIKIEQNIKKYCSGIPDRPDRIISQCNERIGELKKELEEVS